MQWNDGLNAGFSTAAAEKLYIAQDSVADRPTVFAQMEDKNSLYHEIQKLIKIRRAHPALLNKGEIEFVYAKKDTYPFAYVRRNGDERILVVLNPSDKKVSFPYEGVFGETIYQFGGTATEDKTTVKVDAQTAAFIILN